MEIIISVKCALEFECAQSWKAMAKTSDKKIRHCSVCKSDVHMVYSQAELDVCAIKGQYCAITTVSGITAGTPCGS